MRYKYERIEKSNVKVDEYFFRRGWSDKLAYVLGYLWADGSVRYGQERGSYCIRLGCTIEDEDIIWKIRDAFKSDHKITYVCTRVQKDGSVTKPSVHCVINSKRLTEDVINLFEIVPRKSNLPGILYPNYVPDRLLCHFTRGFFDGDGTLHAYPGGISHRFSICGQFNFLEGLQDQISRVVGLDKNKIGKTGSIFRFSWAAEEDIFKLYRWLYPYENLIFLNRKKNYFDQLFASRIIESDLNWVI